MLVSARNTLKNPQH